MINSTNSDLHQLLSQAGGVSCERPDGAIVYQHFAPPAQEQQRVQNGALLVPLPDLIRIRVHGRDRQRFLHNFCTNRVVGLDSGHACEAFFVDVKARILAHGWILASDAWHEIWMLGKSQDALLRHLNKYLITEDVELTPINSGHAGFAACGQNVTTLLDGHFASGRWGDLPAVQKEPHCPAEDRVLWLRLDWDGTPVVICSSPAAAQAGLVNYWLDSGEPFAGYHVFERLRIRERIPCVGVDIGNEHLAPEADRNGSAISYVKGCYLGQEPIARLDAMGHINRALRCVECHANGMDLTGAEVVSSAGVVLGVVTSYQASFNSEPDVGLAMVRLAGIDADGGVQLRSATGTLPGTIHGKSSP